MTIGRFFLAALLFVFATPSFAVEYTTGIRYDVMNRIAGQIEPSPDGVKPYPATPKPMARDPNAGASVPDQRTTDIFK